jgi:4-amino-4-deoxy-L-arabinose transferase-like glycosyltransferase
VLIGAFLRLYQLGQIPPSPDWDEVSLGYNAYSILKTGMDEYGTKFPLVLRSYDDYKPPFYMYVTIPFVAFLGLDVWVVRLPSALFGISAILGTYLLVYQIFLIKEKSNNNFDTVHTKKLLNKKINQSEKYLSHTNSSFFGIDLGFDIHNPAFAQKIALLSALLLAISPWHINFSRIAFEANVGVALNIWGIYFFLSGWRKPIQYIYSTILLGLALYTYHSERVFVPLIVVYLLIMEWKNLIKHKVIVISSILIAGIFLVPLLFLLLNPANLTRFSGTSVFADQTEVLKKSVRKLDEDARNGNPWGVLFDNRRIVYGMKIAEGYLMHYSPKWFFLTSDQERHHAPSMGNLYVFEAPLIILGFLWLLRQRHWSRGFLLFWFFIAPIPASPTTGVPHSIRSLVFLPTFQIFSALGILIFIEWINKKSKVNKKIFYIFSFVIVSFSIIQYLDLYFHHLNNEFSFAWQYGYKQAVQYAEANKSKYSKVVVSTSLEQPYMFFLFYTKYDPKQYLKEGGTTSGGFEEYRNRFGIYEFKTFDWDHEIHNGSILYIGTPMDIKTDPIKRIKYLEGNDAIWIAR